MTENLIVRSVTPDDLAAWRTLWDGYNAFYGREGATALPELVTLTTWARFFDGYEPVHGLVAERGGALVGLAHYIFHRSTTQIGPLCYLQDLFTVPRARGGGIGRTLISAVYEAAAAGGARRVYWQTHESNRTAQSLYDEVSTRSGFIVYRTEL
jgi:GNAT superfamily N-acetyltransferase